MSVPSSRLLGLDLKPPRIAFPGHRFVDVRDARGVAEAVAGFAPDVVIHLAARTDLGGATVQDYSSNTVGTRVLLDAVRRYAPGSCVLVASSLLVNRLGSASFDPQFFDPDTAYGASKVEAERACHAVREQGLAVRIFRPTSIWGPWFGEPYRKFFELVAQGRLLVVPTASPRPRRTYGYVANTVEQILDIVTTNSWSPADEPAYLGDERPLDALTWAREIADIVGRPVPIGVPAGYFRLPSRFLDAICPLIRRENPLSARRLANMLTSGEVPLDTIRRIRSRDPIDRTTGLVETLTWLGYIRREPGL
jgi:nucleoside-diphosphate-sugar epimerase